MHEQDSLLPLRLWQRLRKYILHVLRCKATNWSRSNGLHILVNVASICKTTFQIVCFLHCQSQSPNRIFLVHYCFAFAPPQSINLVPAHSAFHQQLRSCCP
ncbi:hypothetical protein VTP01DRAFT_6340 [Rhizomucor pusillus]|uniref:uncharacterized protein n=1 Tax=Rhizomucor pusillus TaxID=4840 RepID=UPI003743028F